MEGSRNMEQTHAQELPITAKETLECVSEKNENLSMARDLDEAKESETIQPSDVLCKPAFPEFSSKLARVGSFEGWPEHKRSKVEDLADAGFFYIGEEDRTRCYYCGKGLKDWKDEDDPWQQHEYWFGSDCDYVRFHKK